MREQNLVFIRKPYKSFTPYKVKTNLNSLRVTFSVNSEKKGRKNFQRRKPENFY